MSNHTLFFLLFFSWSSTSVVAQLEVSKLFSDHAVLQRDQPLRIWGWATPKAPVAVFFNQKKYTTTTDQAGRWLIKLPATPQGGPHTMQIKSGNEEINLKDILMGDVWICSGQSNMEWMVRDANNAFAEIENANDTNIRHFKVPNSYAQSPEEKLAGGTWQTAHPKTVGEFTAVGYYFAKALRAHVDVPIGLLNTSWGGSRIEPWMSAGTLDLGNPETAVQNIINDTKRKYEATLQKLRKVFPDLTDQERGMKDGKAVWAAKQLDPSGWAMLPVPGLWEEQGFAGFDGYAWYRTTFVLTAEEAKEDIILGLGKIDDSDMTWVNGQQVGASEQQWNLARVYEVPASALQVGKNTIAIRVADTGGGGGIHGSADLLFVKTNRQKISLAGDWSFRLDALMSMDYLSNANQIPTLLYNKMIHPLKYFAIKGALWYQGESNASNQKDTDSYQQLFENMIRSWRKDFAVGDFPFLYVQLANWLPPQPAGTKSHWAELRDAQTQTLKVKNTAQAVIIDIGDETDIHPRNKQDVGFRLALAARKLAYGANILYQSPTYRSHQIKDGKVHLTFDHAGKGLQVRNKYGYVNGFAIAGKDKKFVWAKAKLDTSDTVIIWNDKVANPKYIRYAWADNPDDVNLYNSADLPACPFRVGEE
ncbi:MAG: sialate O-acetylesterase [Bacteroidota bacterium]